MHIAVEKENIEIIKLLLEKKEINTNAKDNNVAINSYGFIINLWKTPIELTKNQEIKQLLHK